MYYVNKRELSAFPFDLLFEIVSEAGKAVRDSILVEAKAIHDRSVARKIEILYSNQEGSYEGNPDDDFPFNPPESELVDREVASAKKAAFQKFAEKYDFKGNALWLLPQFVAYIAKFPIKKDAEGKIDSKLFLDNFAKDAFHKGLWTYATHPVRGDLMPKQYVPEYRNYCALVPLLLMPFKKFDGIKYSDWSKKYLRLLVDTALWDAMSVDLSLDGFTEEEILKAREIGLLVQSGKTAGTKRNPVTAFRGYGIPAPLGKLPLLAQNMVFQTWCAHPVNRTELMVLDWRDWDGIPQPLITTEVIKSEPKPKVSSTYGLDVPWE